MNPGVDSHTPHLVVIDSRGLAVRQVAYCRRDVSEPTPETRVTAQQHDAAGRLVTQRDPRFLAPTSRPNLTTVYSLSGAVLLTDSVDAGWRLGLPGEAGQVLERWDGRGSHWRHEFDEQRRPTAIHEQVRGADLRTIERLSYADNAPEFAERNQCGQLIRHDDSAGVIWLEQQALSGGVIRQTRHFLPDQADQFADWPATEADRDHLLQPDAGYTTESRYNPLGEVLVQADAGGHQQHFSFDRTGQLLRIDLTLKTQEPQPLLKAADYNAEGQLLTQIAGNDVTSSATYEASTGRLERLTASTSKSERLQELSYEYDPVGNIVQLVDHIQPTSYFANQRVAPETTYTYDSLYQLVSAKGRETAGAGQNQGLPELVIPSPIDPGRLLNYSEYYEYDLGGNRTELRHVSDKNPFTQQVRVDSQSNRALPWKEGEDEPDYKRNFDPNGNLQRLVPGAQPMTWDARNQLQSVTTVRRSTAADDGEWYRYNAAGERIVKFSTQQARAAIHLRIVHYLPGLEVRTPNAGEELQVICVPLARGSVRCLHWVKGKPDDIDADQLRYSLDDHLGSSSLEVDKHAAVISHEGYYPFGGTAWWAARSHADADYKTIRYSGKEQDASGLYYYGFRYYAPWLGRWVNPDPAGVSAGLNFYGFCGSNPISRVDPDGCMWQESDAILMNSAFEQFLDNEPSLRASYGLPPIDLQSSGQDDDDESMDYQDSPASSQSLDSPGESSPGSPESPDSPAPPTADQNVILDLLNGSASQNRYDWNNRNLLLRDNFGAKVYRADRRGPVEVLRDGFHASDEFTAVKKMIGGEALIVSETLEGALFYAAQSDVRYHFYSIDATDVSGASLLENLVVNTSRTVAHLGADLKASPSNQTGRANHMHEAHVSHNDLLHQKSTIDPLGQLLDEVAHIRSVIRPPSSPHSRPLLFDDWQ